MARFFSALFLIFFLLPLSAQNKPIIALQLDFTRTDEQDGQSSEMAGSIFYTKNPFVFVFKTTRPALQTTYLNESGAYLLDGDTVYDISEGVAVLQQTCTDFLTWFKADFALAEEGYAVADCSVQDGSVVSVWRYAKTDEHPIEKIVTTADAQGFFVRMQMYGQDALLITQTHLLDRAKQGAYAYPTQIRSERFADEKMVSVTTLRFSRVRFNQLDQSPYATVQAALVAMPPEKMAVVSYDKAQRPSVPAFRVSIPAVVTGAGFSVYKAFITKQDMSRCPYEPSCSQYMLQAVSQNGLFGLLQGIERKRRCTTEEHKRGLYPDTASGKHYDPLEKKD